MPWDGHAYSGRLTSARLCDTGRFECSYDSYRASDLGLYIPSTDRRHQTQSVVDSRRLSCSGYTRRWYRADSASNLGECLPASRLVSHKQTHEHAAPRQHSHRATPRSNTRSQQAHIPVPALRSRDTADLFVHRTNERAMTAPSLPASAHVARPSIAPRDYVLTTVRMTARITSARVVSW